LSEKLEPRDSFDSKESLLFNYFGFLAALSLLMIDFNVMVVSINAVVWTCFYLSSFKTDWIEIKSFLMIISITTVNARY
jgi:hypothetical protein